MCEILCANRKNLKVPSLKINRGVYMGNSKHVKLNFCKFIYTLRNSQKRQRSKHKIFHKKYIFLYDLKKFKNLFKEFMKFY